MRPLGDVLAFLSALANVPKPETQDSIRWTPGLAFHGGVVIECGNVTTTPRAVLWKISPCIIGVWKRDHLSEDETLDRYRRAGGWGKVSDDIENQLGGRWTARSHRTVEGLVQKAAIAKCRGASTHT